mgnify:CR=1 FL=1
MAEFAAILLLIGAALTAFVLLIVFVAVPVFGANGELLGVISLSGPRERFSESAVKKMSKLLLAAGARATLALGGEWPRAQARVPHLVRS